MSVLHFKALNCVTLPHSGASFLKVDSAIDCDGEPYKRFRALNLLFTVIYQTVPVVWLALLWRCRERLNPPTVGSRPVQSALLLRKQDPSITHLKFLWSVSYCCYAHLSYTQQNLKSEI